MVSRLRWFVLFLTLGLSSAELQAQLEERLKPGSKTASNDEFVGKESGEGKELVPEIHFRWCDRGSFTMGEGRSSVQVTLSQGFWLGETEVTQGQWESVMNTTPWKGELYTKDGPNYAASFIGYDDAVAYCEKLTEQERSAGRLPSGWSYTLPTEAQWEYACRAGTKTKYSFGEEESLLSEYGWWGRIGGDGIAKSEQYAHEVGLKKANAWGLRDMHGNVLEWCSDRYGKKLPGGTNPVGASSGLGRVYRGGGWDDSASFCRSAIRYGYPPALRYYNLGFRVAGVHSSELTTAAWAENLSRVEIGKRGKAATAYVETPSGASGTAFCVHPSGLFVTNEHVIRGAEQAEIIVVLEPSLDNQRELRASVVRTDKQTDLALLRVKDGNGFSSLSLGSAEGVMELAEVVACGFPLGRRLSSDKKEYPAISVNSGTITALRRKAGELQFLQTDVALNFGNSGGPVLDTDGKVIGVVVSKANGATGINQAIPVSQLERFLQAPDLALIPPKLTGEIQDKPQVFKVSAASFMPGSPEPDLMLILQAGEEDAREFAMEKQGQLWTATAAPVGHPLKSRTEVSARLGTGTISGSSDDVIIRIGEKVVRLSGVRKIDLKPPQKPGSTSPPKPIAVLVDGQTIEANITGLEKIEIDLGGQKIKLDLAKVTHLAFQQVPVLTLITARVVATVDGKEVSRVEVKLPISDSTLIVPADPSTVSIMPPELSKDKVVKRLPDGFSNVVPGGGGRYLIFHLPKLRKLAVFDFSEARITKYIPLTEDNVVFAAGLDSLVVGLRESGKLERWSLTTFELVRSAPPPFKEDIGAVILGHGSNGPLVVNGYFLDLGTYRILPVRDQKGSERALTNDYRTPSADGTVYGGWKTNQSPDESSTFVLEGNVLKRYVEGGLKHVIPGPDGRTIYTANGICSTTLKRSDRDDASYGYCLPAVRGDYFLSLTSAASGKASFTIYHRGLTQPIAKLDNVDHGLNFDGWDRESFGPWKRVFMVPEARVIAVLPPTNDQVVLYKFDAEQALEKSGQDYLIVTSQPPREIQTGSTLNYAVKVKSKHPITLTLDAGPKEMKVSPAGVLTWTPDDDAKGDQDVILTVKSAGGQEIFHTFTLRLNK